MFRLLIYIFETFRAYLVLAIFAFASIAIMAMNENPQLRAIQSFGVTSIGVVQTILSFIPNPVELKRERDVLQNNAVNLQQQIDALRQAELQNAQLRNMLEFKSESAFSLVAADVVGKNENLLRNTITLNIGGGKGVKTNMAIITEDGLVGRIIASSDHYCIGQVLLHRDCRVSALVERSRVHGIVAWEGGVTLTLKNIVKSVDIKPGDRVVTSEYSSIYPANIEIGIVERTELVPETIFQDVVITPSVEFSKLERVFVVIAVPDSERVALEKQVKK